MRSLSAHMTSKRAFDALAVDGPPPPPDALSKRAYAPSREPCAAPRVTFHLLIVNRAKDSVLASVMSGAHLRLPLVRPLMRRLYYMDVSVPRMYKLQHWEVESCSLEHVVHTQLRIRFHTLQTIRCYPSACSRASQQQQLEPQVMVLGVVDGAEDPCGAQAPSQRRMRWVNRSQLREFQWGCVLDGVDVRSQIDVLLQRINRNALVTHSAPWFWLGWVEAMQCWVRRELGAQQLVALSPLHVVCSTGECCVYRCRVSRLNECDKQQQQQQQRRHRASFDVFVKAVRSPSGEAYRAGVISGLLPRFVPQVLAVNRKHNVVMQKSGGGALDGCVDALALIDTVRQLHMSSLRHVARLKTCGLQVLDSHWLSANFDSIMHRPAIACMECYPDAQRDIRYIRSKSALVRELCDDISRVHVPHALIHGDLTVHNMARVKAECGEIYRFFDWGSSFIGHPLYDLRTLLEDGRSRALLGVRDDGTDRKLESYVVHYLCGWKWYASVGELKNVYELMDVLQHGVELHRLSELYDSYRGIERRKLITRIHSHIRGLRLMTEELATCTATSSS